MNFAPTYTTLFQRVKIAFQTQVALFDFYNYGWKWYLCFKFSRYQYLLPTETPYHGKLAHLTKFVTLSDSMSSFMQHSEWFCTLKQHHSYFLFILWCAF